MKRLFTTVLVILFVVSCSFSQTWKPAGDQLKTDWAEKIDPENPLPEYPRPQMKRDEWKNLNGLWKYAITKAGAGKPGVFDGDILVPFAVESSLSGVQKTVTPEEELWYELSFTIPAEWKKKEILLHFGGVDWESEIWVNDIKIGTHRGGYIPFSFDITPYLEKSGNQSLVLRVWDPTDKGFQPKGKQVLNPRGIYYTAVTGIWQTVWLEPVNSTYITNVRTVPDIDRETLKTEVFAYGSEAADYFEVVAKEGNKEIAVSRGRVGESVELNIPEPELWSPETPFLYDLEVRLISSGKVVDQVESYFAMRKIATKRDDRGIIRLQLNNKDYFQFGPLDQGYWPDGLYTAPTDEALAYDIVKTKEMGFNMIRKHVKVEPARWYAHCDRLGVLVWQDMPGGGGSPQWQGKKYYEGNDYQRSPESEAHFRREWKGVMDLLYSNPSVVTWVCFNESWGQFKTEEIAQWTKDYDPSRLVNPASGGNHYYAGDMLDLHNYPEPKMYLFDGMRANVLGEYGGIGLPLEGHLWIPDKSWGYVKLKNSKEATDRYIAYANQLLTLINAGFSAAVYTQTTDLEGEINGLMTYDRKVIKMELERIREVNRKICNSLNK